MTQLPPLPYPDVTTLGDYFDGSGTRQSMAFTADQMRAYAEQARADLLAEVEQLRAAARLTIVDAECFRFWVSEAARSPSNMAQLIQNCTTEEEYRAAIMPCVLRGMATVDAAMKGQA